VGVLAKAFPRETVEAVVDAAGAREQRRQMLPAWLTVYYVRWRCSWTWAAAG
jgi:hypothetical protein